MNEFICTRCGREVDREFGQTYNHCYSLNGCNGRLRPRNDFDGVAPHILADMLDSMSGRIEDLAAEIEELKAALTAAARPSGKPTDILRTCKRKFNFRRKEK